MSKRFNIITRGVLVIAAVAVVSISATFAALTSNPVSLTTNSLTVATPGLQIGRDNTFSSTSIPGFAVKDLYPSNSFTNAGSFQIKNTGGVPLRLNVKVPSIPSSSTIDPTTVSLGFQSQITGSTGGTTGFSLSQAASSTGVTVVPDLGPGETMNILLQVNIPTGANVTSGATTGNFDFVFTGTQPTAAP